MIKTVSKPLAHLIFLSGVNCYDDIGSIWRVRYVVLQKSLVQNVHVGEKRRTANTES